MVALCHNRRSGGSSEPQLYSLPESVSNKHIQNNADIGGFEIEEDNMKRLDGLDEYLVTDRDSLDRD